MPKRRLVLAHQLLPKHAFILAAALPDLALRHHAFAVIQAALPTCQPSASRQRPATFQAVVRAALAYLVG